MGCSYKYSQYLQSEELGKEQVLESVSGIMFSKVVEEIIVWMCQVEDVCVCLCLPGCSVSPAHVWVFVN